MAGDAGGETERRLHLSASSQHWHLQKAGNEGVTVAWRTLSPGLLPLPNPNTQSFDQGWQQSPGPIAAWWAAFPGNWLADSCLHSRTPSAHALCRLVLQASTEACISGMPPPDVLMRQTLGSKHVGEQTCYLRRKASPLEEAPPVRGGIHSLEVHGDAVTMTGPAGGLRRWLHHLLQGQCALGEKGGARWLGLADWFSTKEGVCCQGKEGSGRGFPPLSLWTAHTQPSPPSAHSL